MPSIRPTPEDLAAEYVEDLLDGPDVLVELVESDSDVDAATLGRE